MRKKIGGMSYEKRANYDEVWMFPPRLEDLVEADHPARFIREFVDALNLEEMGFQQRQSDEGRPNYAADLLAKVWLYGYFQKIRSSRGLERACREHLGLVWLTGMHEPDHNTLWRFWRANQKGLGEIFRQGIRIAAKAELVGMVLHAVDGTRIASAGSKKQAWHRADLEKALAKVEQSIEAMMKEVESAEEAEVGEYRMPEVLKERQRLKEMIGEGLKELNKAGTDHMVKSDPDARMMKSNGRTIFGYNAQAVVDEASGLIVGADVVVDEDDHYLMTPMLDKVAENLDGVAENTVADGGYATGSELAEAERNGREVVVNMGAEPDDEYDHSRFIHDPEKDCCICPRGEMLQLKTTDKGRGGEQVRIYQCQSYEQCAVRWQCSKAKTGRTIRISAYDQVWKRHLEKQKTDRTQEILRRRGAIIERIFGWIKEDSGFRRWTVRGLDSVRTQWLLLCATLNLRTMYRSWMAGKLIFCPK